MSTHSLQMNTKGPAIKVLTDFESWPQNEQNNSLRDLRDFAALRRGFLLADTIKLPFVNVFLTWERRVRMSI